MHRAFGASDPARASRLRRFYPCPCIAPSALLPLPVTIAPLEIPAFLFPRTRRNALTRRFAGSAPTRRREYRRAAAGVHSCHVDARVTRRAPRPGYTRVTSTHASPVARPARGLSSRARAGGPAFARGNRRIGVLIGRESAPAVRAGSINIRSRVNIYT